MRATMVASHGISCLDIYPVASCLLSVTCCVAPRGKVPMQREALSSSFRPWSSGPAAKAQVQPTGHLASPETRRLGASPADDEPRPAPASPAAFLLGWLDDFADILDRAGSGQIPARPGSIRAGPPDPPRREPIGVQPSGQQQRSRARGGSQLAVTITAYGAERRGAVGARDRQ